MSYHIRDFTIKDFLLEDLLKMARPRKKPVSVHTAKKNKSAVQETPVVEASIMNEPVVEEAVAVEVKEEVKAAEEVKEPVVEEAKAEAAPVEEAPVKKARKPRKKAATITSFVQFGGMELNIKELEEKIKKEYAKKGGEDATSIEIYLKPEEKAAYYVVNGVGSPDYKIEL